MKERENAVQKNGQKQEQRQFWRRLTLNKWSLTFALILVMLSAYLGLEEVSRNSQTEDVLYVMDNLPYDVQKVSAGDNGSGKVEVLGDNRQQEDGSGGEENNAMNNDTADTAAEGSGEYSDKYSINSDSDFFINYRLEREKARARQLELLQALIDDEKTGDEVRSEAQAKVIAQADAIESELMLESILVAKYGGEAAVFIQPEKVNVVLDLAESKMTDNEADKIARIVDNYTGIGYENVIIVLKD